jgi:hypothetical protein
MAAGIALQERTDAPTVRIVLYLPPEGAASDPQTSVRAI